MRLHNLLPFADVSSFIIGRPDTTFIKESDDQPAPRTNSADTVVTLNQQHTNHCMVLQSPVNHSDLQRTLTQPYDAVLTDQTNLTLTIRTADCLPILLYHPCGVIGAIHAGRRGTELGILQRTLNILNQTWGINADVTLWLGPCICAQCYEVDPELHATYNLRQENLAQAEAFFSGRNYFVSVSEYCTFHHNQHWYSYRKELQTPLRNLSAIRLIKTVA